jgi:hypothetical protein
MSKQELNLDELLGGFIADMTVSTPNRTSMSVIEFAEQILFNGNVQLFPTQRAILKAFYGESLDDIEIEILMEWRDLGRTNWVRGRTYKNLLLELGRGASKALTLDTIIPTYDKQWLPMGAIHIGDLLIDPMGQPVRVINKTPIMYGHDLYAIEIDGEIIRADAGHLWSVYIDNELYIKTTRELINIYDRVELRINTIGTWVHDLCHPSQVRHIQSISPIPTEPVQCLEVEGGNFLCGHSLIPTHNSTLGSIIILKEFYDLITLEQPAVHYGLIPNDPIGLFVMAQTLEQVKDTLFAKIKGYAEDSDFFKVLQARGVIDIYEQAIKCKSKNIAIFAKHTNSPALVGYTLKALIMDEFARFENKVELDGSITSMGDTLYRNVGASTNRFGKKGYRIAISSAWEIGDPMERLIDSSQVDPDTLTFKLRTWDVNKMPSVSREACNSDYIIDRAKAELEYEGIRRQRLSNFISEEILNPCLNGLSCIDSESSTQENALLLDDGTIETKYLVINNILRMESTSEGESYAHIDFSVTRDATACAFSRAITIEEEWYISVDLLLLWQPYRDKTGRKYHVSYQNVEDTILLLAKPRNLREVSFDSFNSESSIQRFHTTGIKTDKLSASRNDQLTYYTTFRDIATQGRLILPKDSINTTKLISELTNIIIKPNGSIVHGVHGKDLADAVVCSVYKTYINLVKSGRMLGTKGSAVSAINSKGKPLINKGRHRTDAINRMRSTYETQSNPITNLHRGL